MISQEDFANFLYRLNKQLCKKGTSFTREEFMKYLDETATLVLRRNQKMNQLEPGRVYIQYFGRMTESQQSIRILVAPRNPAYINDQVTLSREAGASAYKSTRIPVYFASAIEYTTGWPRELIVPLEDYEIRKITTKTKPPFMFGDSVVPVLVEQMSLMYEPTDTGYWDWNGWNTNDLEVWQLPLSVLQPTLPSLNYPRRRILSGDDARRLSSHRR